MKPSTLSERRAEYLKLRSHLDNIAEEPPGIDDCDVLFTCSSRDGEESLYLRCQEFTHNSIGYYATAMTFDGVNNCHGVPCVRHVQNLQEAADHMVRAARDQWGKGNFCQCSDTKKHRTI